MSATEWMDLPIVHRDLVDGVYIAPDGTWYPVFGETATIHVEDDEWQRVILPTGVYYQSTN